MEEKEEEREPENYEENLREFQGHERWEEIEDDEGNLSIRKCQKKTNKMFLCLCLYLEIKQKKVWLDGLEDNMVRELIYIYIYYYIVDNM